MRSLRTAASWLWRHRVAMALLAILAFGGFLRVQYALPRLSAHRFWDERYNFRNVRKVLRTWSVEPASIYYPSPLQTWPQALVIAGSQWLHDERGVESAETIRNLRRFTPTAYLLARMVSVAYGTLTLAVLFLIGRRLVSPGLGLLAALTLAAVPWHVHASAVFKPDALLVLGVVLAFHLSLRALERGAALDYVWAGLGISLAMSGKVMGGLVALPLVVGTAFVGWRDRRRLALLALAGVSSLASFLVLNPYARYYLPWVAHLQRDYAMRAEQKGMTRGSMPRELVEYLSGPYVHGHVFAALAALGLVWLTVGLFRRAGPGEDDLSASRRAQRAMLVVFPPLYAGAYLLSTPHFKGNNVLPIVPFTTLAGLWLVWEIARRARARLPALGRPAVLAAGAAALVVWLGSPGTLYVYRTLLPSTYDRALAFVARGPGPEFGKTIVIEEAAEPETAWEGTTGVRRRTPGFVRVERLDELDTVRLDRADAEIFLEKRLGDTGFYRDRLARVGDRNVRTIRPEWLEVRGPPLVAVRHARRLAAPAMALELSPCRRSEVSCYTAPLPRDIGSGDLVSFLLSVPWKVLDRVAPSPVLHVAGRVWPLIEVYRDGRQLTLITERHRLGKGPRRARLSTARPHKSDAVVSVTARRWRQPRGAEHAVANDREGDPVGGG